MNKVYKIITDQIIEKLEAGTVPWRMPWSSDGPKNLTSGKAYRGINILLLGSQGYANPYWLTFKQAKSLGGHVKKGAKSTQLCFGKSTPPLKRMMKASKRKRAVLFCAITACSI